MGSKMAPIVLTVLQHCSTGLNRAERFINFVWHKALHVRKTPPVRTLPPTPTRIKVPNTTMTAPFPTPKRLPTFTSEPLQRSSSTFLLHKSALQKVESTNILLVFLATVVLVCIGALILSRRARASTEPNALSAAGQRSNVPSAPRTKAAPLKPEADIHEDTVSRDAELPPRSFDISSSDPSPYGSAAVILSRRARPSILQAEPNTLSAANQSSSVPSPSVPCTNKAPLEPRADIPEKTAVTVSKKAKSPPPPRAFNMTGSDSSRLSCREVPSAPISSHSIPLDLARDPTRQRDSRYVGWILVLVLLVPLLSVLVFARALWCVATDPTLHTVCCLSLFTLYMAEKVQVFVPRRLIKRLLTWLFRVTWVRPWMLFRKHADDACISLLLSLLITIIICLYAVGLVCVICFSRDTPRFIFAVITGHPKLARFHSPLVAYLWYDFWSRTTYFHSVVSPPFSLHRGHDC